MRPRICPTAPVATNVYTPNEENGWLCWCCTASAAFSWRQARAEDYSETLAFVRLLNALLRASAGGAPLPDGAAAAFAQFAGHVREDVLGQLNQRGYKCGVNSPLTTTQTPRASRRAGIRDSSPAEADSRHQHITTRWQRR